MELSKAHSHPQSRLRWDGKCARCVNVGLTHSRKIHSQYSQRVPSKYPLTTCCVSFVPFLVRSVPCARWLLRPRRPKPPPTEHRRPNTATLLIEQINPRHTVRHNTKCTQTNACKHRQKHTHTHTHTHLHTHTYTNNITISTTLAYPVC
jgi:hypothetical protein